MTNERPDSTRNVIVEVLLIIGAVLVNPFVKLKDWLKGERE